MKKKEGVDVQVEEVGSEDDHVEEATPREFV